MKPNAPQDTSSKQPSPPITRYQCTAAVPWDKTKGEYASHPDALMVGEVVDGHPALDAEEYKCPNCGHIFPIELPA